MNKPGGILRNLNNKVGVGFYSKDTYINQITPSNQTPPSETTQEIPQEPDELRCEQMEQEEIPSGKQLARKSPRKTS